MAIDQNNVTTNHSFAAAVSLGTDSAIQAAVNAALNDPYEQDYYTFTLTQSALVTLTTGGSSGDTQLYLFNSAKEQIAYDDDSGSGNFSKISNQNLAAGTYYVMVKAYNSSTVADYSLTPEIVTPEAKSLVVTTGENVINSSDGITSFAEALAYAKELGGEQTITFNIAENDEIDFNENQTVTAGITVDGMNAATGNQVRNGTGIIVANGGILKNYTVFEADGDRSPGDIWMEIGSFGENITAGEYGDFYATGCTIDGAHVEQLGMIMAYNSQIQDLTLDYQGVLIYSTGNTFTGTLSIGGAVGKKVYSLKQRSEYSSPLVAVGFSGNDSQVTEDTDLIFNLQSWTPGTQADAFSSDISQAMSTIYPSMLIDNMKVFTGAGSYTVSVKADQTLGTYQLAGNAAEFNAPLSLTVGENTYTDVLTVGNKYTVNDREYTLALNSDNVLTLSIAEVTEPLSLVVTTGADVVDATDGVTSLREAIAYASAYSSLKKDGKYTITFDDSIFTDDSVTITLNSTLEIGESIFTEEYGELVIQGTEGKSVILDGNNAVQIINNATGNIVTLSDMTFLNGYGITNTQNSFTAGALLNAGTMTLNGVILKDNYATGGYCCHVGGAVANAGNGILNIVGSTFTENSASTDGGAADVRASVAGAIVNAGEIYILGTLLSENSISQSSSQFRELAGGIVNMGEAFLSISNSEINSNTATVNAYGINDAAGGLINKGTVEISDCMFVGNSASGHTNILSGAIMQASNSVLTIDKTSIIDNQCYGDTVWGAVGGIGCWGRDDCTVIVTNSLFKNNGGTTVGAISVYDKEKVIVDSISVYDNSDVGIANISGSDETQLFILNSTLVSNDLSLKNGKIAETSLLNSLVFAGDITGNITYNVGTLSGLNTTVANTFAELDENGKAVLNEDGTVHLRIGGAADGTGVYVWHNEDYSAIAYSETYSGEKIAIIGNVADATILSTDQLGNQRSEESTAIGATLIVENEGISGDLDGNGLADIVMTIDQSTHPANGSTGAWLIQDDQTAAWGNLSFRKDNWVIFGTGWTANKNNADVYVKSADNVIGAWVTDDTGKVTGWETVGSFSADTQILGLGDFNGDGKSDLLLRSIDGMVGGFLTDGTGWNEFKGLGDEWKICGIGDLNGDGRDDVVLKHDAGFAGSWLTQADGTMAWADLDTLQSGFEIVGCGDFNGDGTDDVLLKNGNYYGAWIVKDGNAASWLGLGTLDATVEDIADFNGDGVDDLRVRTGSGDIGAELVMGEDTLLWNYYGSVGDEWNTKLASL